MSFALFCGNCFKEIDLGKYKKKIILEFLKEQFDFWIGELGWSKEVACIVDMARDLGYTEMDLRRED